MQILMGLGGHHVASDCMLLVTKQKLIYMPKWNAIMWSNMQRLDITPEKATSLDLTLQSNQVCCWMTLS